MLVSYNWLKNYIDDSIPPVEKLEELLTFHAFEIDGIEQVGDDTVLDVKVLPDRSPDCLSHRGIAHEIAAIINQPLKDDPLRNEAENTPVTDKITVTIEDSTLCRRFGMALITGVKVGPSPEWLQARLKALGQRSINNVVDATNYVMFGLGQPLHAYDADLFERGEDDKWHFGVRLARAGEKVTTLTGEEYELNPNIQLIVNEVGDVPAGIAGIKGGKYAEVHDGTTNILLEAANFEPSFTRKASQALKLQTDASKRFENGISRSMSPYGLVETVGLITQIAGGTCEGYIDEYPEKVENEEVTVTLEAINARLGLKIEEETVSDILKRLDFEVKKSGTSWTVVAPHERVDITIPDNVIEEVGRIYGYEHVTSVVPEPVALPEINARHFYSEIIRDTLTMLGFSEVITSSFRKKDEIRLQNALASDKGYMRSSLLRNLTEVLDKNMPNKDLLGVSDIRVFEIGSVFQKGGETGILEHMSVGVGVRTKAQGYTPKDDEVLKEVLGALEEVLGSAIYRTISKGVAEFNLTDLLTTLPVPEGYNSVSKSVDAVFKPYSTYPFVTRDIALWVPESLTAEAVAEVIDGAAGNLRTRTTLFDEFKKDGRVSYAFRLVFQSYEKTLTDDEVNVVMDRLATVVGERGWEVR